MEVDGSETGCEELHKMRACCGNSIFSPLPRAVSRKSFRAAALRHHILTMSICASGPGGNTRNSRPSAPSAPSGVDGVDGVDGASAGFVRHRKAGPRVGRSGP